MGLESEWSTGNPSKRPSTPASRAMENLFSMHCSTMSVIWPTAFERKTITYIELALDFEVYTGLDLVKDRSSKDSLADRVLFFGCILRSLTSHASPQRLFPSEHVRRSYSLSPLGISRTGGLARRPILLGGAVTEKLWAEMSAFSSSAAVRTKTVPGPFGWAHDYVPTHQPGRETQARKWLVSEPILGNGVQKIKRRQVLAVQKRTPTKCPRAMKPPISRPPGVTIPKRVKVEPPHTRKRKRSPSPNQQPTPKAPRRHGRSPPKLWITVDWQM